MANIDLQSLISQLNASKGAASGAKVGAQPSTAGQLFGNILGQQQQGVDPDGVAPLVSGKGLPGGKGLPADMSVATPVNVGIANMLAKLAQMPEQSGSLPMQELQAQLKQLMQSDPTAETSIDDLTALTSLMAGVDALPSTMLTGAAASMTSPLTSAPGGSVLDEAQLLQAAEQMGIDPAVANVIMQATNTPSPVAVDIADPAGNVAANVAIPGAASLLNVNTPLSDAANNTANILNATAAAVPLESLSATPASSPIGTPIPASSLIEIPVPASSSIETPVPASSSIGTPILASSPTGTPTPASLPTGAPVPVPVPVSASTLATNNPTAQNPSAANQLASGQVTVQAAAQGITDDVVIRVRQAGVEAAVNATANNAPAVSAQDFFRQRGAQGPTPVNQLTQDMPGDELILRLPDALIQKLDLINQTQTQTQTPAITTTAEALAAPLSGASFKSMAQFSSFSNNGQAPAATAEVPVAEGGSRLQSLLQGDNPAQQAARNMQNQVGQQLQRMVRDGQWQANINLNPARLGQIKINMTMEDGILKTQLLSANQGVRELLEGGMPRLRELLEESGLQLGDFDVSSDGGNQQFAEQDSQTGELNQLQAAGDAPAAAAEQRTTSHDGDLDTFA